MRFITVMCIFIIASIIFANASVVQEYSKVIFSLHERFRVKCLHFITSDKIVLEKTQDLYNIMRLLSSSRIHASVLRNTSINSANKCPSNRPFNVIFVSDADMAVHFRTTLQVPSYPRWLLFLDVPLGSFLDQVNVPFDCQLILAERLDLDRFEFTEVYRVHASSPLTKIRVGTWSSRDGLHFTKTRFYDRRDNLQGHVLRVGARHSPPILTVSTLKHSKEIQVGGFFGELWHVLEEELNFTSEYFIAFEGQDGLLLANGSWTGSIKLMLENKVDVAISDYSITPQRVQVVHFLFPALVFKNRLFVKKPTSINLEWDNFLEPFNLGLWMSVLASVFLLGALLGVTYHVGRRCGTEEVRGEECVNFGEALLFIHGLFCGQGHGSTPGSISGRIVYQIGAMTGIILVAAYAATLISFLTTITITFPVNNFQEILDTNYKIGLLKTSGQYNLLANTAEPVLNQVFSKLIKPFISKLPTSSEDGLNRICQESDYGFITSYQLAMKQIKDVACDVIPIPDIYISIPVAMVTAKNSPYHGILNNKLLHLRDSGLLRRMRSSFWPVTYPEVGNQFVSVTLEAVTPIFSIVFFGICCGVIAITFEAILRKCYHIQWRNTKSRGRHAKQTLGHTTKKLLKWKVYNRKIGIFTTPARLYFRNK